MGAVLLGWVAAAYFLSSAALLVPVGRAADIRGRKKVFALGVLIFTASSLLCAASGSSEMLISSRIAQGAGAAMIFATTFAILSSIFPAEERGRVLGLNLAATYLGLTSGPLLGGLLAEHAGWRSVFVPVIPLGAAAAALIGGVEEEWAEARGEKFDLRGALIYGPSLALLIFGFSLLPQKAGLGLILAGVGGIAGFVRWESKAQSPLLDVKLFRENKLFAFSNLAALATYAATAAVAFILSLYLQYVRGLSPSAAGLILLARPALQTAFSPLAGRLSDRFEPRIVASAGLALIAAGLSIFIFLGEETSAGFVLSGLALLGLGMGFFSSPNANALMSSVERRSYGVASGTLSTMRLVGHALSFGVVMLAFSLHLGEAPLNPSTFPSFLAAARLFFLISLGFSFAALLFSAGRGRISGGGRGGGGGR